MTAGRYDIIDPNACEQGATYNLSFIAYDSTRTPINLTGYTAFMRVGSNLGIPQCDCGDLLNITTTSSDDGIIVLGGALGTVSVTVPYAKTQILPAGTFYYDLFITSSGNIRTRVIYGIFTINPMVQ